MATTRTADRILTISSRRLSMRVLSCVAASLLTACASSYQAPTSGATATLTLRSPLGAGRAGLLYADAQCSRSQFLATPEPGERAVIAAGKPIWLKQSFNTVGLQFGRYCEALVTFVPRENATYAVDFTMDAAGCASHVMRIEPSGNEIPEPSATSFSHPKCETW
jgi:hypothetical protein